MPLIEALWNRKTTRDYKTEKIPVHVLSGLLWAGFGVNRPQTGHRTAPSALNTQDISIYVAAHQGLFRYNAGEHSLQPVLSDDIRRLTILNQPNVAEAPIQLIYVSNYGRLGATPDQMVRWSWAHTGLIAQNVYLYCAAAGLATVVRARFVQVTLENGMNLGADEHVTLVQAVGYPQDA
jgi:SagB-type dehydrogenase family enzyme